MIRPLRPLARLVRPSDAPRTFPTSLRLTQRPLGPDSRSDPVRWRQLDALFDAALDAAPADRAALVADTAARDPDLARELQQLLERHAQAEAALGESAVDFASPMMADLRADLRAQAAPLAPGDRIGPFRVIEEVGRGGMGAVYLAERADDQYRKRVAVKLVKRGMDTDEILRRFRRERQILASLEHPNIARLHDGGATADGRPWLAMEYVDGQRIDHWCRAHDVDLPGRVRLIAVVCRAAEHAHRNHVVHRDIKPSNILVAGDGEVRLLDFGIAKLLNGGSGDAPETDTATGRSLLTPAYASPEQLAGDAITPATDVYALGVLLRELATGERTTGAASIRLPRDLDTIVTKATAESPAARYPSAGDLGLDLERYLAGDAIAARRPGLIARVRRAVGGRQVAALLAAGAALALVAAVLLLGRSRPAAAPVERTLAVIPISATTRDSADAYLVHGVAEDLASRLGRLRRVRVKSPRAVTATSSSVAPEALGRLLGVNYLIESTIGRRDSLITVSLRLVEVRKGFQLWSDDYQTPAAGLQALEDSMVRDVAAAVAGELTAVERTALASQPSSSADAYDHFLRANYALRARTPVSVRQAINEYAVAASLDPRFAEAIARESYGYLLYVDWGWPFPARSADQVMAAARSLAARALEIDPGSPEVWLTQAYLRAMEDPVRFAGAADAFARSVQLDSLNPEAQHQYGQILMMLGRDQEALDAYRRTLTLEPGRPMTLVPIAAIYSNMNRRNEAKRYIDSAMAVTGTVPAPYALAVWADFTMRWGDASGAAAAARRALSMDNSYPAPALAVLAVAESRQGHADSARAAMARALASIDTLAPTPTDVRFVGPALADLGRTDDALDLLERARPRGAQLWFYLRSRAFDPLRQSPRLQAVWRETDPTGR